ncbi:TetR/AcrR family transcriptional regulator [Roseomonas sp. OT10]|uniref:TetR/AcrR family transcriptional regulator n=1 Tax=Roseomonas cutis TaxID=2897332 RepID=UPI001E47ED8C|nr:TetR/AcrR family transcriptional regulator [Roseomonas sp. OT10]UFN49372.1 TetR/AcrR family transcriptional regulator [Roseomonas sp. OT10]
MSAALLPLTDPEPTAPSEAAETSPKRRAILDAAGKLFMDQGYAAVSMDAVARAAGVSKATLYAHFAGKDALFGAIVGERCVAMAEQTNALVDPALPIRQALCEVGRSWLGFILRPASMAIHRVVMAEGGRFPDLARAFHEAGPKRGRVWLAGWMALAQQRGELLAEADPKAMAGQFGALLRGELYLDVALGFPPDEMEAAIEAAVLAAVDLFLRAYGTPAAAG